MVARQVHLVRHGEVHNPRGVLYGTLPDYALSDLGQRMAIAAADYLGQRHREVRRLVASPLQRTQESAAPIAEKFGLSIDTDERLIEPANRFEGTVTRRAMRNPKNWPYVINPFRPGWGEPYASIAARMRAAVVDAFASVDDGDVVLVSHQLPIWVAHLSLARKRYMHDPRKRRCALSSITTLALEPASDGDVAGKRIAEVGYAEPAASLIASATDVGAV